jgi:protein tyrosine phosphatase (PTP) superfamily phosphohydrolase (DUF442 family)
VIQDPRLARIPNLRCIDAVLATGGQPDADGLTAVVCSGYGVVVNLGLDDAPYALAGEAAIVRGLGADYHHLPVSFEAPTRGDLMHFVELMDHLQGRRVFVHCALNKRPRSWWPSIACGAANGISARPELSSAGSGARVRSGRCCSTAPWRAAGTEPVWVAPGRIWPASPSPGLPWALGLTLPLPGVRDSRLRPGGGSRRSRWPSARP